MSLLAILAVGYPAALAAVFSLCRAAARGDDRDSA